MRAEGVIREEQIIFGIKGGEKMGLYIQGIEMPKTYPLTVTIYPDGQVLSNTVGAKHIKGEAVPVPAHGRLGDLDALKVKAIDRSEKCGVCVNVLDNVITAYDIETAPTIIPADRPEKRASEHINQATQ